MPTASGGSYQNATYDGYTYQYQWTETWQGQGDGTVASSATNHVSGIENGTESGWSTHFVPEGSGGGYSSSSSWGGPWGNSYDDTVSYPGFSEARYYGRDYGGGSGEEDYVAYVGDVFYESSGSDSGFFPYAYSEQEYLSAAQSDGANPRVLSNPDLSQRLRSPVPTLQSASRASGVRHSLVKESPQCSSRETTDCETREAGPSLYSLAGPSGRGTAFGQASANGGGLGGLWAGAREIFSLYGHYFSQNLDYYQAGLDAAGCIPGAGEPFDALNAGISAARGDWTGAGLSAASMIPMWGDAVGKGGKIARYVAKYGDEALAVLDALRGVRRVKGAVRSFESFDAFKAALGPAGDGKVWHHIVEQRPSNIARFGPEAIHNTANVVAVPREVNQKIANYYSSKPIRGFTGGKTVREWLDSQSYEEQQAFGLKILQMVLEGKPLP